MMLSLARWKLYHSVGKTNSKRIVNVTKPKGNRPDTTENRREGQHQHIQAKQRVSQQKDCNLTNEKVKCMCV